MNLSEWHKSKINQAHIHYIETSEHKGKEP